MERGLIITNGTELDADLLMEAEATARGSDAGLVVLSLMDPDEFEEDIERLEAIGDVEHTHYGEDTVLNAERDSLREDAEAILGGGIELDCHVSVAPTGDHVETALDVAERFDCDHLFITGRKRSPTGKALFGDVTQQLLLQFPGYVTVSLE